MFVMPFQTFLIGMPALFTSERGSFLFFDTDFTDDTVYGIIICGVCRSGPVWGRAGLGYRPLSYKFTAITLLFYVLSFMFQVAALGLMFKIGPCGYRDLVFARSAVCVSVYLFENM